jgi:Zn-dependent peptidase ImmA (M78 family)
MTTAMALTNNASRARLTEILQGSLSVAPKGDHVLTWSDAHRIAHMAAAQAHGRLSVDLTGVNVDVFEAIRASQTFLMFRPMPRLFGAYLAEDGSASGIIINSGLPRGARRHTAAHELGHAQLQHTTSVDDGSTIDTVFGDDAEAIPPASHRRRWTDQEKVAEAFASWFLMPRRVVRNALNILGTTKPTSAADVYQLSLLLGASYRTTLRHLSNLKLATTASVNQWAEVAPRQLKAQLDSCAPAPKSRRADVYQIVEGYGSLVLPVEPSDRLIVPAHLYKPEALPSSIQVVGHSDVGDVLEVGSLNDGHLTSSIDIDNGTGFSLSLIVSEPPKGLDPRSFP